MESIAEQTRPMMQHAELQQKKKKEKKNHGVAVGDAIELPNVHAGEHVVNRLRELFNVCLAAHEFRDGAVVQQLIMMVLDSGPPGVAINFWHFIVC